MVAKYVFATFLKEVKKAWKGRFSQPVLIDLLYQAIIECGELEDEYMDRIVVDKTYASLVFRRQPEGNVKKEILNHIDDELVKQNLPDYFENDFIPNYIKESDLEGLIHRLNSAIQEDDYISPSDKEMVSLYVENVMFGRFMAKAYILSLLPPNVAEKGSAVEYPVGQSVDDMLRLNELYSQVGNRMRLEPLEKPDEPKQCEDPYIKELLRAYASFLHLPIEKKTDLPEEWQDDFEERRDDYYAAETVHVMGVNSLPGLTIDRYDELKTETCRIVKPTNRKALSEQVNGYECMMRVMEMAQSTLPVDNVFCKVGFVGPIQNRGFCHMLAGEKKLHWVKENE